MIDAFKKIIRSDGILGLWRGLGPALLLVSHGSIQFTIYEELKRIRTQSNQRKLGSGEAFVCGALSKICAQVCIASGFSVLAYLVCCRQSRTLLNLSRLGYKM